MHRPVTVTRAALLWLIAVGAGVVETSLAVTDLATQGDLDDGIWVNLAVRVVVYTGAALLVAHLARGRRWARWCLAGLLSVVGLAAMVVPSVVLVTEGTPILEAVAGDGPLAVPFLVVRTVHVAAVVAATVLMFSPTANRYFAPAVSDRRTPLNA